MPMSPLPSKKRRRTGLVAGLLEDPDQTLLDVSADTFETEMAQVETAVVEIAEKEIDAEWATNQKGLIIQALASEAEISEKERFWILGNLPTGGTARPPTPSDENHPSLCGREHFVVYPHTHKPNDGPVQWITYSIDILKKHVTRFRTPDVAGKLFDLDLLVNLNMIAPRFDMEGKRRWLLERTL